MARIVIALGGNALGKTLPEQMQAVKNSVKPIADLIEQGNQVVVSHGNGPQVGMIDTAMSEFHIKHPEYTADPLSVCVAMSQGYIGYDLQCFLREELLNRGIDKPVATIVTQVRVDRDDKAFLKPTKPIGAFMGKEQAMEYARRGEVVIEDAGRGYRRVVASPKPSEIVELRTIRRLIDDDHVVIAAGGGGIPVALEGNALKGMPAVVDKDFASSLMARDLDADFLVILTAVEKVAVNFGKPDQRDLDHITLEEAQKLCEQGQFAPGSMLPKVEAAMEFASSKPGRKALITLLEKARDGLLGKTGTIIEAGK